MILSIFFSISFFFLFILRIINMPIGRELCWVVLPLFVSTAFDLQVKTPACFASTRPHSAPSHCEHLQNSLLGFLFCFDSGVFELWVLLWGLFGHLLVGPYFRVDFCSTMLVLLLDFFCLGPLFTFLFTTGPCILLF